MRKVDDFMILGCDFFSEKVVFDNNGPNKFKLELIPSARNRTRATYIRYTRS